jgi:hypothetical protein
MLGAQQKDQGRAPVLSSTPIQDSPTAVRRSERQTADPLRMTTVDDSRRLHDAVGSLWLQTKRVDRQAVPTNDLARRTAELASGL